MTVAQTEKHQSLKLLIREFKFSVIIPAYNNADSIAEVIRRTAVTMQSLGCSYEIIVVNDGSADHTWEVLEEEVKKNCNVIAIDLVKNYGQHPAMFCGLRHSSGDYVITIDADLQNPPEEMVKLIERASQQKYDLIFGKFVKKKHSLIRRGGSFLIGLINEKIFDKPRDLALTNYRLMSRDLVTRMCRYKTPFPYLNGLALKFSRPSKRTNVLVEHEGELHGQVRLHHLVQMRSARPGDTVQLFFLSASFRFGLLVSSYRY